MKIELRQVKIAKFMSRETTCFEANVYIDGMKVGSVENDGQGGCNNYTPWQVKDRLDAYGTTLPPMLLPQYKNEDGEPMELTYDADLLIGDALEREEAKKSLFRKLKTKLMWIKDGKCWELKAETTKANLDAIQLRHPSALILNTLTFDEALDKYMEATKS